MSIDQHHSQDESSSARKTPELAHLIQSDRAALSLLLASRPDQSAGLDTEWHAAYLNAVSALLLKVLHSDELVEPLRDLVEYITSQARSAGTPAHQHSEIAFIHAFASAELSYLLLTGMDEAAAAQQIARKLIAHKVPLPADGGDARGWVRLLKWREALRRDRQPEEVFAQYERHFAALKANAAGTPPESST